MPKKTPTATGTGIEGFVAQMTATVRQQTINEMMSVLPQALESALAQLSGGQVRRRGRPPGSKNKVEVAPAAKISAAPPVVKRPAGRPKGSRNKIKTGGMKISRAPKPPPAMPASKS
jgi:hypothetical protein